MNLRLPLALAILVTAAAAPVGAQFTDVTSAAGVEVIGVRDGGACFGDIDRDGDYDVYVPRSAGSVLMLNDGAGVFQDVTADAISGLTRRVADSGCAFADFNNDGWLDLARTGTDVLEVYLSRGLEGGSVGFGDDNGDPQFLLGGDDPDPNPFTIDIEGLGVLDYNGDARLDLVVQDEGDLYVLENEGDGDFTAAVTGLPTGTITAGDHLAVADLDVDGDVDILPRLVDDGSFFRNNADGTFSGFDLNLPADAVNKGGTIVCDFNNDGRFDVFFTDGDETSALANRVLVQDDTGDFTASAYPNIAGENVEGAACADVDHDGDVDLALNVFTSTHLYINQLIESGTFSLERDDRGIDSDARSRGLSFSDIDNDGDLDLFAMKTGLYNGAQGEFDDGPNALFRNDIDNTNYLLVRVWANTTTCPTAPVLREDLGAVVQLLDQNGSLLAMREISGGADRSRTEAPVAHFGLPDGPDESYQVRVRFQFGGEEVTLPVVASSLGSPQLLEVYSSDPDADGIPSAVETEQETGNEDQDGDGLLAALDADADGDGVPDSVEAGDDDPCTAPVDSNDNGVPDYLEPSPATPGIDAGVAPGTDGGAREGGMRVDSPDAGPVVAVNGGADLRGGGVGSCAASPRRTPPMFLGIAVGMLLLLRHRRRGAHRHHTRAATERTRRGQ